jgi:hypothetical protein
MAIALSEGLNLRIFANLPPYFVYLNGVLVFVSGLSIVRAHNCWERRWPLLVTLTGWVLALGGLMRMFAPEFAQQAAHRSAPFTYGSIALLLLVGVFLTSKAIGRRN